MTGTVYNEHKAREIHANLTFGKEPRRARQAFEDRLFEELVKMSGVLSRGVTGRLPPACRDDLATCATNALRKKRAALEGWRPGNGPLSVFLCRLVGEGVIAQYRELAKRKGRVLSFQRRRWGNGFRIFRGGVGQCPQCGSVGFLWMRQRFCRPQCRSAYHFWRKR